MFVDVGFPLERDIAVTFEHPFNDIPDIKRYYQHLGLLFPVNALMVKDRLVIDSFGVNEHAKRGKGDARKLAQIFKRNYFHALITSNFMPKFQDEKKGVFINVNQLVKTNDKG